MKCLLPLVFVWTLGNGVRVFDGFTDVTDGYYSDVWGVDEEPVKGVHDVQAREGSVAGEDRTGEPSQ